VPICGHEENGKRCTFGGSTEDIRAHKLTAHGKKVRDASGASKRLPDIGHSEPRSDIDIYEFRRRERVALRRMSLQRQREGRGR
jgi:hypothetical protein